MRTQPAISFPPPPGERNSATVPERRLAPVSLAVRAADLLLRGYQFILSPWLGPVCRFTPSCSNYARQALQRYGLWRGAWLGARRLLRCHPFHPGGHDPVV